jgi:probable selenium-dependent hydroxylase accessory protein YqeC
VLGSGGKTSLLALLAHELARTHPRVLVSTSTKVYPFPGLPLVEDPAALEAAWRGARAVFLGRQLGVGPAAGARGDAGKLGGLAALAAEDLRALADVVLLEADGARGRPLKVHQPLDPGVPASADLALLVIGAAALGAAASAETVHRLERAPAPWGLREGEMPTPRQVARVLLAPDGYLGQTGAVPTRILINQADAWPGQAARLAEALSAVWPGSILSGSAQRGEFALCSGSAQPAPGGGSAGEGPAPAPPPARVALILAAAGTGRRFGADKRRFLIKGAPLFHWSLGAYARLPFLQRIAVLGPEDADLAAEARARGWQVAVNPEPATGLSGSWRAGLAAVKRDAVGALLALGDMPAIRRDTVAALLAAIAEAPGRALRPVHAGRPGHPYYLPRSGFAALAAVAGDLGARALADPFPLDSADPGVILDLDHPAAAPGLSALLSEEPAFHAV